MTTEQLISELVETIRTKTEDDVFHWFVNLNKKYKKLRKEGKVDDDLMIELAEFWVAVQQTLGEDFIDWLEEKWDYKYPALIADISEFFPRYGEVSYKKLIQKMNDFEIREAELLADAIWEKNMRVEIQSQIFDWDKDEELGISLTVPRDDRNGLRYELMKVCAKMVYNRGTMVARFFSGRGEFEVAGVKALTGTGEWSCLSEWELSECYEEGLYSNEKAIILEHKENDAETDAAENSRQTLLYFDVNRKAASR